MFCSELVRSSPAADSNQSLREPGGKRKGGSSILTSTPEKLALKEQRDNKQHRETNFALLR
jgi:hypothetical protein